MLSHYRIGLIVALFLVGTQANAAGIFTAINDDFENGPGNWITNHGFTVVDMGGNNVLARNSSSGLKYSNNSTPLTAGLTISTLIQADLFGPGPGPASGNDQRNMTLAFHLTTPNGIQQQTNALSGYHLTYYNGFGLSNGLTLRRKDVPFGPLTTLGSFQIDDADLDNLVHSLMITDDGTGMIEVFWDGVSVIQVDDSANYLGADGQFVGIYSSTNAEMTPYIDNFRVLVTPEPASIAVWTLLGVAGLLVYRRRRRRAVSC